MFGDLGDFECGDNEYNNMSLFLEGVVNYHFSRAAPTSAAGSAGGTCSTATTTPAPGS